MHPDPSFPALHRVPATGWINDPNGIALVDGRYHVFFQFNPYSPHHERIHWGHVSSPDLLRWREEPVALTPRTGGPDEHGCWSGSFVDDEGTPTLLYSGVDASGPEHAAVVLATGDAALREWTPEERFVPGSKGPDGVAVRDPFLFTVDGVRYAVQGGGTVADGQPTIDVYRVDDLREWTHLGALATPADSAFAPIAGVQAWECPNLFQVGDTWVLIVSPLTIDGTTVGHHDVWWFTGTIEVDAGIPRFHAQHSGRLDAGVGVYAPQVLVSDRVLLWSWLVDTGRPAGAADEFGWSGCLSLPLELTVVDGIVRTAPAPELTGLRQEPIDAGAPIAARAFELAGDTDSVRLELVDAAGDAVEAYAYDGASGPLRLFVDGSVVEAFEPDGTARTARAYPAEGSAWRVSGGAGLQAWRLAAPV